MKFSFRNAVGAGFWIQEGLNCEISLFRNASGDALTSDISPNKSKGASTQLTPSCGIQVFWLSLKITASSSWGWNPPFTDDGNKPSRQEDLISPVHSLTQKVDSLFPAQEKDLAMLAAYCNQQHISAVPTSSHLFVYNKLLQAPHPLG
ncbi:hypothetical protein O181_111495 [Austropuccinia psidii MF-1]|uniref:Uncharacterized protein n=1 Tax=Austropuccinia psidii MF-1 TaxID=1389203 RepID=A0A9Q3K2I5_9BASI|nr:hypothetical protein [Austropuccinia psidii MF-1]